MPLSKRPLPLFLPYPLPKNDKVPSFPVDTALYEVVNGLAYDCYDDGRVTELRLVSNYGSMASAFEGLFNHLGLNYARGMTPIQTGPNMGKLKNRYYAMMRVKLLKGHYIFPRPLSHQVVSKIGVSENGKPCILNHKIHGRKLRQSAKEGFVVDDVVAPFTKQYVIEPIIGEIWKGRFPWDVKFKKVE